MADNTAVCSSAFNCKWANFEIWVPLSTVVPDEF